MRLGPFPVQLSSLGDRRRWTRLWRTGLLLTSTAALGGLSFALWNRRTLLRLREEQARAAEDSSAGAEELAAALDAGR